MKLQAQHGASAIEFALVLPLLVMLVFGIIEFSLALYDKAVITNASREGARAGIVQALNRPLCGEITGVVDNYCKNYLITFGAASTPATSCSNSPCPGFGQDLTVTVTYHYDFLVLPNFISSLVGGTNLRAETVMRCE